MVDDASRLDDLVTRLREMSARDRGAILAHMTLEQRYSLEELLDKPKLAAPAPEPASQTNDNLIFSTALARMLDDIADGRTPQGGEGAPLTEATCAALNETATVIRDDIHSKEGKGGHTFGALLNRFLFPERG